MPEEKPGANLKDTAAVIVFSDTHENHIYGLGPPTFTKEGGDTIRANPIRRELWGLWNRYWDEVIKITDGLPRVAVALGDIIESDAKIRSQHELVSLSPNDALNMVTDTLDPIYAEMDAVLTIRGTEAHTGKGAWQEENVAANYDHSIPDTQHSSVSWWQFYGAFGGVYFDIAHHASMGNVKRNVGGAAGRLAFDVMTEYITEWEARPPDYVLRAHNHRFADSGMTYRTRAVMVGCFQFKTTFLHRIGKGYEMPNLGGAVIICDRGKSELMPFRIKPKKVQVWKP